MKNLIIYLAVMILTFYIIIMYNRPDLIFLLVAEALLLAVMLICGIYLKYCLRIRVMENEYIVEKDKAGAVRIELENKSFIPLPGIKLLLEYHNGFQSKKEKVKLLAAIGRREKALLEVHMDSRYCGVIYVTVRKVVIYDFLRLFSYRIRQPIEFKVKVLPSLSQVQVNPGNRYRHLNVDSDVFSKERSGDDPSEIFKIRDYINGDRLQKIHWKISAKRGRKMVKEFSLPLGYHTLLVIDLFTPKQDDGIIKRMDALLQAVLSVSFGLLEADCLHYICWYDCKTEQLERLQMGDIEDIYIAMERLLMLMVYNEKKELRALYDETYLNSPHPVDIIVNYDLEVLVGNHTNYRLSEDGINEELNHLQIDL